MSYLFTIVTNLDYLLYEIKNILILHFPKYHQFSKLFPKMPEDDKKNQPYVEVKRSQKLFARISDIAEGEEVV